MTPLPFIHLIHAFDAPQHLGKLKEILQRLKTENRVHGFVPHKVDDLSSLNAINGEDMVIIFLTREIEAQKKGIVGMLNILRNKYTGIKIAEIIVDHVPYENQYHTFPEDLRPIREREDMDTVWSSIERSLKDRFPIVKEPLGTDWTKYLKYTIPALIIFTFLFWWLLRNNGSEPQEVIISFTADKATCDAPCKVSFTNTSENIETYKWVFHDGSTSTETNPSKEYDIPGEYLVTLITSANGKLNKTSQRIIVSEPPKPIADFKSSNSRCVGPCEINFTNASQNADSYSWSIGDEIFSGAANPSYTFSKVGSYDITLIASGNGQTDSLSMTINIVPKLIVDFNINRLGSKTVYFMNKSSHADSYRWSIGNNRFSSIKSPTYSFPEVGSYNVTLTASGYGQTESKTRTIFINPNPTP